MFVHFLISLLVDSIGFFIRWIEHEAEVKALVDKVY